MNEYNVICNIDENTPFKWKKHLILPFFGLRNFDDVKREIHRYKSRELERLVDDIKQDMMKAECKCAYLISFVPIQQEYKLPNVMIKTVEQLEKFYSENCCTNIGNKYTEIWFFKKNISKESSNLVGRISFNLREVNEQVKSIECAQTLEQVWNANHREIEKYNGEKRLNFIAASRMGWNRRYKINEVSIPMKLHLNIKNILKDFRKVTMQIESYRENIEEFCEYLKSLGINEVSLEYMMSNGEFSFIDWDSPNDKKVVNSLIKERVEER